MPNRNTASFARRLPLLLSAATAALLLAACGTTTPSGPSTPTAKPGASRPQAAFVRPAAGATIARFDGKQNKGLDIAGKLGDPVVASADGRVVIVSSALRGYGTMIIVKHNETFLTAYAHIQRALVKENDVVRQGQPIAEMGSTGADRVKLHFELRKQGVAVDPQPYLDGRAR